MPTEKMTMTTKAEIDLILWNLVGADKKTYHGQTIRYWYQMMMRFKRG